MSLYDIAVLSTNRLEDFEFGGRDNVFTIEHSDGEDDHNDAPVIKVSLYESDDDHRISFEIDPAYDGVGITLHKSNFGRSEQILQISVDKHELLLLFSAVKGVLYAVR
jgi:hypothetical protein